LEKDHGGLWEFPGGKVEDTEFPVKALIRELREELGIAVRETDCWPSAFAESGVRIEAAPIVILLYTIACWEGTPAALEGGEVRWFTAAEVRSLAKPPLDCDLAAQLFGGTGERCREW
jgi:8-oxo-dGTP diphosphatase